MAEDQVNHFIARKAAKPPHERPQTFSAVDQTLFMLQMQLDELRAGIDDAKAMAVQAGNMPRQAAGGEDALPFSGTAYIAGNKTTGLNNDSSKPWVRCFLDTGTAEENAGPPPNPFPFNEEWYEKAQTSGDIHIPRA